MWKQKNPVTKCYPSEYRTHGQKFKDLEGNVGIYPVYLRMALIFTDFPTRRGSGPCVLLEIYEYQRHP